MINFKFEFLKEQMLEFLGGINYYNIMVPSLETLLKSSEIKVRLNVIIITSISINSCIYL